MAGGRLLGIGLAIGIVVGGGAAGAISWMAAERHAKNREDSLTERIATYKDDVVHLTNELDQARSLIDRWKSESELNANKLKEILESHIPREELDGIRQDLENQLASTTDQMTALRSEFDQSSAKWQEKLTAQTATLEQQLTDQTAEHAARIDAMTQRLTSATTELADLSAERDQMQATLQATEANLTTRTEELAASQGEITELKEELKSLRAQVKRLNDLLDPLGK